MSPAEKKKLQRAKLQKKAARLAIEAISQKAGAKTPDVGLWRLLVVLAEASLGAGPSKTALGRWGLDAAGDRWTDKRSEKLLRLLREKTNESQARALLLELFLEDRIQFLGGYDDRYPASLSLAAEYFGVDLGQLEKDAAMAPAKPKAAGSSPASRSSRRAKGGRKK